ncbi:acyl carrier protein [Streptomyces sp. CAU 1734]|uniref:acyl carrier protein n=1 Tax=Streptomyces sp. CAU 1734 TaxID=3140360 RepID=UPI0032613C2F
MTIVVHGENPPADRTVALSEDDMDRTFDELDVDSPARVELVETISDTCQVEISDAQAGTLDTPRAVLEFVAARRPDLRREFHSPHPGPKNRSRPPVRTTERQGRDIPSGGHPEERRPA